MQSPSKGKSRFTSVEYDRIIYLLDQRTQTPRHYTQPKHIRDEIRDIGYYHSDFFPDNMFPTIETFKELIKSGQIKIDRRRFWWVNHKQTHRQEIDGGYIWSPKADQNGARNQSYINLSETQPGDIVYSYASAQIKAVGVVAKPFFDSPKPEEFNSSGANWESSGWMVAVDWQTLEAPFRPKDHIDVITSLLPDKYSPIQLNGNGNQKIYLAEISSDLHKALQGIISELDNVIDITNDPTHIAIEEDREVKEIESLKTIGPVEKESLVKSRIGQGQFRKNVLQIETKCRVTSVSDERFLIASHIKPWRHSTKEEKLDGNNGLMLSPHIDKLFDRGWISFSPEGDLLTSLTVVSSILDDWGVIPVQNVGPFNEKQARYLEYHMKHIFIKGHPRRLSPIL